MKKSNFPEITVITPSYNQAKFITQTIKSVLDQNYPNLQYWVMDGKSTDETVQILKSFGNKLEFVSQKDGGQTAALNNGISKAAETGEKTGFFAYINSDDYYLPGTFEKVQQAFGDHPEKMWLVGDAVIVDAQNREIQSTIRSYKRIWRNVLSFFWLTVLNPLPQPAVFIRKEALLKVGTFNESLHYVMDYEYWLRLYTAFGKPLVLSETLAAFRIHTTSKGSTGYTDQFREEYAIASKYTGNWLALLLHRLHNQLIFTVYSIVK